ncbi:MAG: nucleotidyltransferase domain-containing protein [Ignavibacteriaceae bacterium]|nr:nucleotidyltransferase domain-containing protein [Ignavibacteriaceae bacterium]
MKIQKTHKLSEEFINKLADLAAGYISSETFDKLLSLFQSESSKHYFVRSSESNLLRILSSAYDKFSFLNDCIKYPHHVEIIVAIASNSNYLTDILVRNPEYFYWIANPSNLEPKLNIDDLTKSVNDSLNSYKNFNSKVNFFRSLKRKEMLRIGLKDILGLADLGEITEELSILAKVITAKLFELSLSVILSKYQIKKLSRSYCLIGLGKLGGGELNYSSDIDLIVFYDEDQAIKNKSHHELLTEAIYLFIDSASSITESGFIYRVDFRLRPDGRNSPLCRSVSEYLNYYESRGEDWERQMLIKANFIGGSSQLFQRFYNYLLPFIYPSSFSVSPTEQIKKLKNNIERNLGSDENIKLLPGGIRDIEFSVQALQLLNGGRIKELQTGNSLAALTVLNKKQLLSDAETDIFKNAYIFYRKIEHYLQLMNDKQTHKIPAEGELLEKLSTFLKFKSSKSFLSSVKKNRTAVTKVYRSILGQEVTIKQNRNISEIQFTNGRSAEQNFSFLREGKGLLGQKEFDERTISAFHDIEPFIINYLKNSILPDTTLQNFVRIIKHSSIPFIWYRELRDEKLCKSLLTICEFSQRSVDLFAEDNELVESIITRRIFEKFNSDNAYTYSLKRIIFTLSVQFTLGLLNQEKVSLLLSEFYRQKISELLTELIDHKYPKVKYFVAALGSLGTKEMTFNSDIDLIFVISDEKLFPNAEKVFQNILSQIKNLLPGVEIDFRLRPEGKNSKLIWDIQSYNSYIQKRFRIWELQAFTKISFLSGDKNLYDLLLEALTDRLLSEDKKNLTKAIREMRLKLVSSSSTNLLNLKKSPGGLVDIEFILQYFTLSSTDAFRNLSGRNIKFLTYVFGENNFGNDFARLFDNYTFLKNLNLMNQCSFNTSTSILPTDKKKLTVLAKQMKMENSETLIMKLNDVMKQNKLFFQKFLVNN